jgi:tetratricopeptide (TPR) repeat protein
MLPATGPSGGTKDPAWNIDFKMIRNRLRDFLVAGLILACLIQALPAQSLREPVFMSKASPGFEDIYNIDYERAEQLFQLLKKEYPQHPAPPLYLGIIAWLKELFRRQDLDLDLFLSPSFFTKATPQVMPPLERKFFFDNMEKCRLLAQSILDRNPRNLDAIYFLGAANGILASFSITIDRSLRKAFGYGNQAYDLDHRLLVLNPNYYDAYMSVGLYQYIVGSIPWYFKWLASIAGYHGTKEEGFKYVDIAAGKGEYAKVDAKILQMVLRVYENRPRDALRDAEELHRDFPRNYIFHINIAQILEQLNQSDRAVAEYLDVVRLAEEGKQNYSVLPLGTFRYTLGNRLFRIGRLAAAEGLFRKSILFGGTPERERALSQLRLGQVLDLQGKRQEAIVQYQNALKMRDFENSQDLARKFLLRPYRGSAN